MLPQDDENSKISNKENEENPNASDETEDEVLSREKVSETGEDQSVAESAVASAIARPTGDSITVENIENIENVETVGEEIGTFMSYFPHLVVGLISIVALVGLIFIMVSNSKNGINPSETARSLITYLVAVFTIVVALTLTLMAFFSNLKDFKERFAMGKEVLTILIGVLGTIIGFYFGSAPLEKGDTGKAEQANVSSNSNSAANGNSAINSSVASFTGNNNSSKTPDDVQQIFAKAKEREGFEKLIAGDYESAISAFQASEDAWNGYHNTYDIARLLRKNKTQMEEPAKKKEVFGIIVSQHLYGAPADLMEQIKAIAGR